MHLLMTAPCLLGLEGLVADELRFMEAENVSAENGRVFFEGDEAMLARANINSRFAERILIVLDRFKAETFEELFQAVKALPWSEFIGSSDTFPVKGYSINSTLHSVPDCQKIIKKAVGDHRSNASVKRNPHLFDGAEQGAHGHGQDLERIGEADDPEIGNTDGLDLRLVCVDAHDKLRRTDGESREDEADRHHEEQSHAVGTGDALVILCSPVLSKEEHAAADEAPVAGKHEA